MGDSFNRKYIYIYKLQNILIKNHKNNKKNLFFYLFDEYFIPSDIIFILTYKSSFGDILCSIYREFTLFCK